MPTSGFFPRRGKMIARTRAQMTHTHFARRYHPLTQRAAPVLTLILISRPTKQHCQIVVSPTAVSCVFSQLHAPNCAHIGYVLVLNAIERPFRACVIKLAMFCFKSNSPRTHKLFECPLNLFTSCKTPLKHLIISRGGAQSLCLCV